MTVIPFRAALKSLHACADARAWSADRDLATVWAECLRGDWLLWLAARAGVDRRLVVEAACDCAEIALVHVRPGEERPRIAIETARRWARGEATIEEVRAAAAAAAAYAAAAAAYAAAAAARTKAHARCADLVRARISADVVAAALAARS